MGIVFILYTRRKKVKQLRIIQSKHGSGQSIQLRVITWYLL